MIEADRYKYGAGGGDMALANHEQAPPGEKIDRELFGDPIVVGERSIQPVARLAGWYSGTGSEMVGGAGAVLQLQPVKIIVQEEDDSAYEVEIVDETQQALKGMAMGSLALAGICGLLIILIKLISVIKKPTKE
jgi:hypothetical protein